MSPRWRSARIAAAIGVLIGGVAIPGVASAGSSVPFTDSYADGTLTLCGTNNQPVTSGSLVAAPFAWKVVSSSPAPAGYTRAFLLAYQPIQYVDPGNWTGYQLTDDSSFTNPVHPVAQATYADVPLLYADHSMPPRWDGLYELRMYFTAVNRPEVNSPYPAAVIRVTGDTWTLLSRTSAACTSGTGVSAETFFLPKSRLDTPQSILVDPNPAGSPGAAESGSGPGHPSVVKPTPITASTPSGRGGSAQAASGAAGNQAPLGASVASGGNLPPLAIGGVAAGALAFTTIGIGLLLRHRRKLAPR